MQREDIDLFFSRIDEDCFSQHGTKKIYNVMKQLYRKGKKISPISIAKKMEYQMELLTEIAEYKTLYGDFEEYLTELKKYKKKRELVKKANELQELAREELEIKEYQNKAEELIFEIEEESNDRIYNLDDSLAEVYMRITGDKENNYIKTGYPSLDAKVGGLIPGHLTVVAASTSMGKSAFAINLAYNLLKRGKGVCFISLEMEHHEITERLLVQDSRVPKSRYRRRLKEAEEKNIDESLSRLMDKNMTISDKRGLTTVDIKARARRIARKHDFDLIVIDYLQNIMIENDGVNHAKAVGIAVNELRNLAQELNCNVLLLSQVNRGTDGIPRLKDLRDSGEIEENADEVWFPYRPHFDKDKGKANPKDREDAKLILAKGRTEGTGAVNMVFYGKYLTWRDAYIDEQEGGWL